jgi:tetratricopeptide (TPR) repeat protein
VATLEAGQGGVGVQVRVEGHGAQRRSTVKSTVGEPRFTGRDAELRAIDDRLQAGRVVVLHGAPGLGKSRLAKEYAHRHVEAYPGGMFFVPFDQPPPIELAKLLRDTDRPAYQGESVEDQCRRALHALGSTGRTLLIYDAIADERTLCDWLPYEGLDWHLIVTSTSVRWSRSWHLVEVVSLRRDAEHALVASIVGNDAADRLVVPIAAKAAGITIELCASAAAAHERLRRGRTVEHVEAELAAETASSFESAWTLLSPDARIVLQVASTFVTSRVPASLLVNALQRLEWTSHRANNAIDNARDRALADGDDDNLRIHQLVAQFVRARAPTGESLRRLLFLGLLDTARAFSRHPGDLHLRALMLAHSLDVEDWAALVTDGSEWSIVGSACAWLGRFEAARRWFERSVAAKEKGDAHGRMDFASLGESLHCVGCSYSRMGKSAEALPWLERAVAAKEKGDVHGRVDSASLGASLHEVSRCYSDLGKSAEALPWLERAVAAKEKGDVHGRVNSASLGASLRHVGDCYAGLDRFAEALPWFERAVAAKEKGDVRGRVDVASVGRSLCQAGVCYAALGKFAEALPWFEQAVAAQEKGDVHGRIDSEGVGVSLHELGDCYAALGRFAEALPWLERAVAAKQKGDLYGRVNSASLEASLRRVDDCRTRLDQRGETRSQLERAAHVRAAPLADHDNHASVTIVAPGKATAAVLVIVVVVIALAALVAQLSQCR